jgi:uncharacterized protein (TIGR03083 family)
MESGTTVSRFIETIQRARTEWTALIDMIDQADMQKPGEAGSWSLKDIIAHITWHEREMVGLIKAHALVGSELWNLPTDERNDAIYEEVKNLPLEQVLEESAAVYKQLIEALPSLSDDDLVNPEDFTGMPPDWKPGNVIAQNTYEHYEGHIPDVQRWLEELRSG